MNPKPTTVGELHHAIGGRLLPADAAGAPLGPVVTDSRAVAEHGLFWALKGPNYNASDFAAEAFCNGAAGAVVDQTVDTPDGHWTIEVEDTTYALKCWAKHRRMHFTGTPIAVTGSVGKTTTRQMMHTVLSARFMGTASPRNYNNHLGVPLSLTSVEPHHDYAVLELGANHRGEISSLAELCVPKVAAITQVGEAHLGEFGSRRAIAESKAELLAALPPEGHALLGDDPWLRQMAEHCRAQITWVGEAEYCGVRAENVMTSRGMLCFDVSVRESDQRHSFRLPVWGKHHLTSALLAVAAGRLMGLDLAEMADALEKFQPVAMRCEVLNIRGATIINDAYNSNPTAMRAALELLGGFDEPGRRIVVAGDMAELGKQSPWLHWQTGKEAVAVGCADLLIACGKFAQYTTRGAKSAGMPPAKSIACESIEDTLPYLGQAIQPGDVVLIKGSRMMAMEKLIEALKTYPLRRVA